MKSKYKTKERQPIKLRLEKANQIISYIDDYFNVKCNQLGRKSYLVIPRQMSMYYIRKYVNLSFREIGELFLNNDGKGKNHATVLHACKTIENLIEVDSEIMTFHNDLEDVCLNISKLNEFDIQKYNNIKQINKYLDDLSADNVKMIAKYIHRYYTMFNK